MCLQRPEDFPTGAVAPAAERDKLLAIVNESEDRLEEPIHPLDLIKLVRPKADHFARRLTCAELGSAPHHTSSPGLVNASSLTCTFPEMRRHDAQMWRIAQQPLRLGAFYAAPHAGHWIPQPHAPVPDDAADVDLVVQKTSAALIAGDQRRHCPRPTVRAGLPLVVQRVHDVNCALPVSV